VEKLPPLESKPRGWTTSSALWHADDADQTDARDFFYHRESGESREENGELLERGAA